MERSFENILSDESIRLIVQLSHSLSVRAWLVGGGLRDAVMGRPMRDIDLVLDGGDEELPREFAARLGGKFFWLDRERRQSRVVKGKGEEGLSWDFAPMRGRDILEDLALRDFTVNSLALPLADATASLLDPMGGLSDIRSGSIRSCGAGAFDDDPLRLVRAVRFAATLGFGIEASTRRQMGLKSHLIARVAGERLRDELLLILAASGIGVSLGTLRESALLQRLLPCDGYTDEVVRERITRAVRVEETVSSLERYFPSHWQRLEDYLLGVLEGGVNILSLVKLAGFISGMEARPRITEVCDRLRLGTRARKVLCALCGCAVALPSFPEEGREGRAFYRFFRDRQPAGPELLLLPLSERLVAPALAARLVSFYFDDFRPTDADLLLTGDQVMEILCVPPGPGLGRQLECLREAESLGLVTTEEEAAAYIRKKQLTREGSMG